MTSNKKKFLNKENHFSFNHSDVEMTLTMATLWLMKNNVKIPTQRRVNEQKKFQEKNVWSIKSIFPLHYSKRTVRKVHCCSQENCLFFIEHREMCQHQTNCKAKKAQQNKWKIMHFLMRVEIVLEKMASMLHYTVSHSL